MNLIADIASGETDLADVLFLIALVVFLAIAFIDAVVRDWMASLRSLGLALLALAFLVL